MDTSRPDGVSRRRVLLRVGTGGLTIALLANGLEATRAQEATPPAGGGLPAGVNAMPLAVAPIADMPTGPFTINLTRLTLEPGALVPNSASPFPSVAYLEAGSGVVCPPADDGRVVYGLDGKVVVSGGQEFAWPVGTACYTAPNNLDGVRNDGTDRASILAIDLVPTESMGTPSA